MFEERKIYKKEEFKLLSAFFFVGILFLKKTEALNTLKLKTRIIKFLMEEEIHSGTK